MPHIVSSPGHGVSLYLALLPLCTHAESMSVTVISFDSSEGIEFERHRAAVFNKVKSMKGIVVTLWMSLQVWCRLWLDVLSTKLDFNLRPLRSTAEVLEMITIKQLVPMIKQMSLVPAAAHI